MHFKKEYIDQGDLNRLSSMVVDSVNDHIAVVDREGYIVGVNQSWIDFGRENGLKHPKCAVGNNYIEIAEDVNENHIEGRLVSEEIKRVLNGDKTTDKIEYPCHSPETKRWFICEVTGIELNQRYAVVKHIDITKRKKAEEWAEFIRSTMNHDLKNKIQLMEGYIELLNEKIDSDQKNMKNYINKAINSIDDTKRLIQKIQSIEKIKKEQTVPTELQNVITNSINDYKQEIQENDIKIKTDVNNCTVMAGSMLQEVFKNLIMNSIQHADCSKIEITSTTNKDICSITYQDDGKGIPENNRQHVFEKGFSSKGGTGLGLHLVEKIINHYNGDIELKDSEKGVKFLITLKKT
ncbi:Signal transduction histidine kinase containing PAS domain [Methanonatronarchaeum thermophilum]|uniref:histidine kinase n=1 Tax=Methanonatronarchaeum thermophilum TaxID=1927129 RepID=A0A1Y3GJJ9_9EURY|nr:PAS domain-containing sensor histidine kinase [Methanonatronarchaeum thermophilum]OUJ19546.1 Signal transduction histidine kinase containing PAS domain [Methanonatronarchaeum thermophilum]